MLKLILAGCLLCLVGCTVGPDYEPPDPVMPPSWGQSQGPVDEASADGRPVETRPVEKRPVENRPVDAWWDELGDDQLTELITRAVQGSPTLAAAAVRIGQSRAILQQVGGQYVPDLDGQGAFSRFRDSVGVSPFPLPAQDLSAWSIGLDMLWEIDVFGRIRRSVESAGAGLGATIEDYHDALIILQADVALAYVQLRTLQRRLAVLEENIALQTSSRDLAKARFETEVAPELDVFQAESNLANTEALLPGLQLQLTRTLHRLAVLLGEHAGALNDELSAPRELPAVPEQIAVGIPAELLRRRPDIRRAERQLASQFARIGAAEALLYPQFSLSGAFGAAAMDLDRLFSHRNRTFSLTPGMRLNIFDGGRVRGAVDEETALAEVARLAYDNVVLLAVEETENSIAALRRQREQRDALQRVVTAAGRQAELAEELYKQGLRSFQNVLDAQRTLTTAQDALSDSEGAVVASAITLYRALGGGWQAPADPEASLDVEPNHD